MERRTPDREQPALLKQRLGYSVEEAAELVGVCRGTLYAAIAAGRLKARKLGRRTIILASDLNDYLTSLPTFE